MSRRINRLAAAALAAAVAVLVTLLVPLSASAAGDDYPYASVSGSVNDPWGFTERQCVSFAAWRLHQNGLDLNNYTQNWGNATNWDATAARLGYQVSATPVAGSIAQWHSNEQSRWTIGTSTSWMTAGPAGHVAYVSGLYPDGTVQLEQYNMGGTGTFSSLRASAPRYLVLTRSGAPVPYGAIGAYWSSIGGYASFLGAPTSAEYDVPGGRAENFAGGIVFWSPGTGAHEVHGAILGELQAMGSVGGLLGFPVTNESSAAEGRFNSFQRGDIYWSPATGAHEVHGAILGELRATGGVSGLLGFPTTRESGTPDGAGRFNFFARGGVYWTPWTGAHEVHGAILDLWGRLGRETSSLGYPTSDEYGVWGGRESRFQRGGIDWSASTGATWVVG